MNAEDIIGTYGPLNPDYLNKIIEVIRSALNEHPRIFALRVDLRLPDDVLARTDSAVKQFGDGERNFGCSHH